MDITLQLLKADKTHTSRNQEAVGRRGDIIGIYPTASLNGASPSPTGKTVFIHVTGVPDTLKTERVMDRLANGARRIKIDVSGIPAAIRRQLRDNLEVTVTWAQIRDRIYLRKEGVRAADGDLA